jgi:prolyl-tRNA synthetase
MTMVHSDDKGLVLPPRVAPYQVVIVPIYFKDEKVNKEIRAKATELSESFTKSGIRCFFDDNMTHNPGWKFNHWELKGVPLRIELGPKDLQANQVVVSRRDDFSKQSLKMDGLAAQLLTLLDTIQRALLERARSFREQHVLKATTFDEFMAHLDQRNLVLSPFCDVTECEESVKDKSGARANDVEAQREKEEYEKKRAAGELPEVLPLTGAAKSLCKPLEQPALQKGTKCFNCGKDAKTWCLWGRYDTEREKASVEKFY